MSAGRDRAKRRYLRRRNLRRVRGWFWMRTLAPWAPFDAAALSRRFANHKARCSACDCRLTTRNDGPSIAERRRLAAGK